MYQALYRKWRPQTFSDVVGQSAITDTLKAQVESGRLSHAYLFAGSRGTGKTTCAKILSKAVNCLQPNHGNPCNACETCLGIADGSILDVVEIDAASNNGVDGVRELRDEAVYSPAAAKKRVYIIDEVHMFSNSAFNALLKILEEPPEHVLFILATTELHKVPATILSRCQRFSFKRIGTADIMDRLLFIARSEEIKISQDAAQFIARIADGGMRDALSIFEQCASYGHAEITVETVEDVVGLAGSATLYEMLRAIANRDTAGALAQLTDAYLNGRDLISVLNELSACMRDILIAKTAPDAKISRLSVTYDEKTFASLIQAFDARQLIFNIDTIAKTMATISHSANRRIDAELCIIKLCDSSVENDLYALNERVSRLEKNPRAAIPGTGASTQASQAPADAKPAPQKPKAPTVEKPVETAALSTETPAESGNADELWSQIVELAKKNLAPGVIPLLREVAPQRQDNILLLMTDNDMVLNLLGQRQYMEPLRESAKQVTGHEMLLRFQKQNEQKGNTDRFDELCLNLKDLPNVTIIPE